MKNFLSGCFGLSFLILGFALPALDFALVVRIVYIASVPDLLSPFFAVVLGCVLAVVVCIVGIAGQGITVMEIVVPSLILLVLLVIMVPVAARLPATRRANLQKRALKAKRQQKLQPTPRSMQ